MSFFSIIGPGVLISNNRCTFCSETRKHPSWMPHAWNRNLYLQFRKSACQNFIIIIDCCHSGAFFNNNRGLPKGLFALTACDEQGLSYEDEKGGIFTNIIINGLTSDYIDADRDGKITFSELFDYVIDEIKSNTAWRSGAPQKWEWNVNNRMRFIKEFFDDDVKTLIEHIKSLRIKKVKSENTRNLRNR